MGGGGGGGWSKWISNRVYKLTSRLVKFFVDYFFSIFVDNERKPIAKVSTSPMFRANGVRTRGNLCDKAFGNY